MYGTLMLFEAGKLEKGERIYLGDMKGKNEAWLRNTLFNNPEIIPIGDIDSAFGPLIPLCTELRTDAGQVDAAFINESGRLTIIECKLWHNPEARRKVIAQTLDYVVAISGWSYDTLQAQIAAALRRKGNILFELVRKHADSTLREADFHDAVSRSLREGRILALLAGDGIRGGIPALTELVNRNATKAFSFGLMEMAVYGFGKNRFAVQPRVLAKTEVVTRQITIVNTKGGVESVVVDDLGEAVEMAEETVRENTRNHDRLRVWWQPIVTMDFDDKQQEQPRWQVTNNILLSTPYPGIQIKAWATVGGSQMGVYLTGTSARLDAIENLIRRDKTRLLANLPKGTVIDPKAGWPILLKNEEPMSDSQRHAWLKTTLNEFANVLRPHLKKWYEAKHIYDLREA
jgi:hypothetical protein